MENVFVYGSLKRGFVNHHLIARAKFLGVGTTRPRFAMLNLGRYPGVVRGNVAIGGELYLVPRPLMGGLDRLEANGRVYRRELVPITTATGTIQAWIYIYLLARGDEKTVRPTGGIVIWRAPGIVRAAALPCDRKHRSGM